MILSLRNEFIATLIGIFVIGASLCVIAGVIGHTWGRSNAEIERFEYCQKALTEVRVTKTTMLYCLK